MPRLLYTTLAFSLAVGCLSATRPVKGDEFVLHGGGRIRGEQAEPSRRNADRYIITTDRGMRLTLAKDQVKEIVRRRDIEIEYERIAPTFADTAEQQWKLAEWCRTNRLKEYRAAHLRRVIELDPSHFRAWRGLGYTQVRGQWVQEKQFRKEQGYIYYRGRWRLSQEIELLEEQARAKQLKREWLGRLKRWRKDLSGPQSQQAQQQFLAIRDTHAIGPLLAALQKERFPAARLLYVQSLAGIPSPQATAALVNITLNHPDQEVFYECIEQLTRRKTPEMVDAYIEALKDKNNVRVNRAAYALKQLEAESSVGSLIDALVTTHQVVYVPPGGPDAITTTFTRPAGGNAPSPLLCRDRGRLSGMSAGGKAKIVPVTANNQQVLAALVQLSNTAGFGFDERAWRNWYAQESRRQSPDGVRRN